jgi:hypothetical protein
MEENIHVVAQGPEAIGVADVEFHEFDAGHAGDRSIACRVAQRSDGCEYPVSPLGKGAGEIAANVAIRSRDKSFHDQRPGYRLRRGSIIEVKNIAQVKQSAVKDVIYCTAPEFNTVV